MPSSYDGGFFILVLQFVRQYSILETLHNPLHMEKFLHYIKKLKSEKNKDGSLKNPWSLHISDDRYKQMYEQVQAEGLELDGIHITIQSTGISYDYVAYKNKMLLAYPESIIDVSLVMEGDDIEFKKENGQVIYSHKINNPFASSDIVGAYAIIKNKRGEHLTTLNKEEINKHRKVAKTDYIWSQWEKEMTLKTIIKKACKLHFADIYENILQEDNKENDIEQPIDIELSWKQEIEKINTVDELKKYYEQNRGRGKEFDKLVTSKKISLTKTLNENI